MWHSGEDSVQLCSHVARDILDTGAWLLVMFMVMSLCDSVEEYESNRIALNLLLRKYKLLRCVVLSNVKVSKCVT